MANKKSFKENYERLEEIVDNLSNDQKDIDEAIELFKEGIKLYKECENKLNEASKEVIKITETKEEIYEEN